MSLESSYTSNNFSTRKDARDNPAKIRRRNILYLIHAFLRDEGFFETADSLVSEAHVTNEYEVCDNVDLDIILQEYSNYHFLKYNKNPLICKKNKVTDGEIQKTYSNTDLKKNKIKSHKEKRKSEDDCKKAPEEAFIITQLKERGDQNGINKNLECFESLIETKPFTKFIVDLPADIKEIAEALYQTTKCRHTGISWNDIKGLDNAKTSLKEAAIYPLKYPSLFQGLVSPWKGILLYGPPGGGKTLLAKALASEFQRTFFNISASLILSKWRGESEKNIKVLFDLARYYAPSIIFIDEFEALASKRDSSTEHEASRRLKSEILIELDGLGKTSENILFLATSNLPWEIDPAILRRLEKRIYIPLPNEESRQSMFTMFLENSKYDVSSVNISTLAEKTDGYSGSDIRVICKEAAMISVRKRLHAMNSTGKSHVPQNSILQEDLETSILKTKPTAKLLSEKYVNWSDSMGAE